MKKNILKIFSSLMLGAFIFTNFAACGQEEKNKVQTEQKPETNRHSRTPKVNTGMDTAAKEEKLYKDGEIVTLADGSKLKYKENGNHEIIEKGQGKVIIFKTVTEKELSELDDNQRALIERQMKSDENGFYVVY